MISDIDVLRTRLLSITDPETAPAMIHMPCARCSRRFLEHVARDTDDVVHKREMHTGMGTDWQSDTPYHDHFPRRTPRMTAPCMSTRDRNRAWLYLHLYWARHGTQDTCDSHVMTNTVWPDLLTTSALTPLPPILCFSYTGLMHINCSLIMQATTLCRI